MSGLFSRTWGYSAEQDEGACAQVLPRKGLGGEKDQIFSSDQDPEQNKSHETQEQDLAPRQGVQAWRV